MSRTGHHEFSTLEILSNCSLFRIVYDLIKISGVENSSVNRSAEFSGKLLLTEIYKLQMALVIEKIWSLKMSYSSRMSSRIKILGAFHDIYDVYFDILLVKLIKQSINLLFIFKSVIKPCQKMYKN